MEFLETKFYFGSRGIDPNFDRMVYMDVSDSSEHFKEGKGTFQFFMLKLIFFKKMYFVNKFIIINYVFYNFSDKISYG